MRADSPPQVEGGSCPPAHTGVRHTKRDDEEHQRRPARDVLNADAEPPCALSRYGANGDVGVWQEDPGDLRNYARLLRGAREPGCRASRPRAPVPALLSEAIRKALRVRRARR